MKNFITKYPVFLYLLPVFFVLHGYTENYNLVPFQDAVILTAYYIGSIILLLLIFKLVFRNFTKAALFAFILLSYHLFFGTVHDTLKKIIPDSFLTKYIFILPFSLIVLLFLFIVIKKNIASLTKVNLYLNMLFLLLVTLDAVQFCIKIIADHNKVSKLPGSLTSCENCPKPDVYLIIADEYAGQTELSDLFQFNNTPFLNQLVARNFYTIPESTSNYNYTPFSMASILNMDYLNLENSYRQKNDLAYSYQVIKESKLIQFFKNTGYQFYNYSIFDFEGQPAPINMGLLPVKTKLITSQTFLSRINRDLSYHLVTFFKSKKEIRKRVYSNRINNELFYKSTIEISKKDIPKPKFVYTHIEMPHYPYYYDKNGVEQPFEKLEEGYQINKSAYIEYLQYSNTKLLELVDHILKNSKKPPIIILMGDHGFRHFTEKVEGKYYFLNLTSLHFPDKNYEKINDSLSGVNLFRLILNKQFQQHLPYLKDSTSYLKD
ncbi:MAG: sulfatase-like hydrolase/transferase [Chitinophagaceae bacterium]